MKKEKAAKLTPAKPSKVQKDKIAVATEMMAGQPNNTGVLVTIVTEQGSESAKLFTGESTGFVVDSNGYLKIWVKYTTNLIAAYHPSAWRAVNYLQK